MYIPTATGFVTGLVAKDEDGYVLYPRNKEDLADIPSDGIRMNGEKVVYFVPSKDPKADLFISETIMGDMNLTSGTKVDTEAVPGVILILDARDYNKSIANSVASFPSFDGNDILVVQKTSDGGATWQEIDRLFSLPTADGQFTGKVSYPFLKGYCRKPGVLGTPGIIADVQGPDYTALENKRLFLHCFFL